VRTWAGVARDEAGAPADDAGAVNDPLGGVAIDHDLHPATPPAQEAEAPLPAAAGRARGGLVGVVGGDTHRPGCRPRRGGGCSRGAAVVIR
jgi:hypothetical protein